VRWRGPESELPNVDRPPGGAAKMANLANLAKMAKMAKNTGFEVMAIFVLPA
jgi:hypothetical protein